MRKTACVVLAASLIFPLLVSRAAPAAEEPAAAPASQAAGPAFRLFGADLPEAFRLPPMLESLSPQERRVAFESHAWQVYMEPRVPRSQRPRGVCLAASEAEAELCAAAARISYSRPCLAAGDCPALEDWKEVMGTPGLRPAPRSTARAADGSPWVPEQR